jgi:hypothetical protein
LQVLQYALFLWFPVELFGNSKFPNNSEEQYGMVYF